MRRMAAAAAIVLLILAIPAPALAFVARGGDTVIITDPVDDDLYVGAQSVDVRAPINGDLVAGAYRITVSAPISGGVLAAGQTVVVEARVERSVRAAGRRVTVEGSVGTDAVLAGTTIRVTDRAQIGRDLVALGGRIRQAGSVGRNAVFNGGRVTIAGTIAGNVEVNAQTLVVTETARIGGRLTYTAQQTADIRQGAQISGGVERREQPQARRRQPVGPFGVSGFRWFAAAAEGVWLLILGLVAVAISTRGVFAVTERIRRAFLMSLFGGFVLAVVVPIAGIILCITVVGIPLGIVALLLYAVTLYPAMIFTAAWLGERIVPPRRARPLNPGVASGSEEPGQSPPSPYLIMVVGVVAMAVLMAIPIVGWIFRIAAVLVGFGALWAKIWAAREAPAATAPPVAPTPPSGGPGIA